MSLCVSAYNWSCDGCLLYKANGKIGHAGPANSRFGEDFRTPGDLVEVSINKCKFV